MSQPEPPHLGHQRYMFETGQWTTPTSSTPPTGPDQPQSTSIDDFVRQAAAQRAHQAAAHRASTSTVEAAVNELRELIQDFLARPKKSATRWLVEGERVGKAILRNEPSKRLTTTPDPLKVGTRLEDFWRFYRYQRTRGETWHPSSIYTGAWILFRFNLPDQPEARGETSKVQATLWLTQRANLFALRTPRGGDEKWIAVDLPRTKVTDGNLDATPMAARPFWGPRSVSSVSADDLLKLCASDSNAIALLRAPGPRNFCSDIAQAMAAFVTSGG